MIFNYLFLSQSETRMILTIQCLFWGTGNDKEEECPQQARALTGGCQHVCCLTVPLPDCRVSLSPAYCQPDS